MYEETLKYNKQLSQLHQKFLKMKKKGKMKLKRTIVGKQQACQFDFSNYPFYYNYPEKNISLEDANVQTTFSKQVFKCITDDFESYRRKSPQDDNDQIFLDLAKPINTLKQTQKTLFDHFSHRIKYLNQLQMFYLRSSASHLRNMGNSINNTQSRERDFINAALEKCQIERRSYINKITRLSQDIQDFKFGEKTQSRVQPKKNEEGQSKFIPSNQQIQFSNIQKTDFVVYARRILHEQRMLIPLKILLQMIKLKFSEEKFKIISNQMKLLNLNKVRENQKKLYESLESFLQSKIKLKNKKYFEDQLNIQQLKKFCTRFCIVKSRELENYANINFDFQQLPFVPIAKYELDELIEKSYSSCLNFKNWKLPQKTDIFLIKANNFITIRHRTIRQSFDSIIKQTIKDQDYLQKVIKMQMNSIFEQQVSGGILCFDKPSLHYCLISSISWDKLYTYSPKLSQNEKLVQDRLNSIQFYDPDIRGLFSLLDVSQEQLRNFTFQYVEKIQNKKKNRFQYFKIKEICPTQKQKIIQILVRSLNKQEDDVLSQSQKLFLGQIDTSFDKMFMATGYNLTFLNSMNLRFKLFHILNSQNCIQKSIISKLCQLSKDMIPFEFTDAFNLKFSRFQTDQVQQYLNKKQSSNECESVQQDDRIHQIYQQKNQIPITLVKCQNRRDNQLCFNQNIIYKFTQQSYRKLSNKMHKLCCHYIEKHENNLPFSDFNQIIDRYQMFHDIIECELKFNYAKLKLMQSYYNLLKSTVQHQEIFALAEKIMNVKSRQFIIRLENRYFVNQYKNQIDIIHSQVSILQKLAMTFKQIEEKGNKKFKERLDDVIITNQMPQVSLNYYCLDSSLKKKETVKEQKQEEVKLQCKPSNLNYYENNQYFLQKDFKEYLQTNNNRGDDLLQMYNKKREQLIGFNEKLILNDQFLGSPMWFGQNLSKLKDLGLLNYQYLWNITSVIDLLRNLVFDKSSEKLSFYKQIESFIQFWKPADISSHQQFDENMFSVYLQKCSKDISSLQQMLFQNPVPTIGKFQSHIIESVMNYQKLDLTSYRGLYLGINFISVIVQSWTQIQSTIMKKEYLERIYNTIKEYGQPGLNQAQFFQKIKVGPSLLQFPDLSSLIPSGSNKYEYLFISKAMLFQQQMLFTYSNCSFMKEVHYLLMQQVNKYEQAVFESNIRIEHKCTTKNQSMSTDLMVEKQQLKRLQNKKRKTIKKQEIFTLISQRQMMFIARKKQVFENENVNINQMILYKKYLNRLTFDLKSAAVGIYQLSKFYRMKKHFSKLKITIMRLLQLLPFMKKIISTSKTENLVNKERDFLEFPQLNSMMPDIKILLEEDNQKHKKQEFINYSYESLQSKARKYIQFFSQNSPTDNHKQKLLSPLEIQSQLMFWQEIAIFLHSSLLWFSIELSPSENVVFRGLIIQNQSIDDFLFQSSKYLLSPQQLNRLRRRALQSELFSHYEKQYRIYDNLKSSYKLFVQQMAELLESLRMKKKQDKEDIIENVYIINKNKERMLYIALKELELQQGSKLYGTIDSLYDRNQSPKLNILALQTSNSSQNFPLSSQKSKPTPFNQTLKNSLGLLFSRTIVSASQYISKVQYRSNPFISCTSISPTNCHLDNLSLQQRRFIQERLNQLRKLCEMYNLLKNKNKDQQILIVYYKLVKMRQAIHLLDIKEKHHLDERLVKIMQVRAHQGLLQLTALQKNALSHHKTLQNSKIYEKVSHRILTIVVETKILEQMFMHYMYHHYIDDLTKQLKLLQYLDYDKKWEQKFKQEKAIKQLQNKVLVPKIKLNPFFSSPLCLTNYFIPHTSKLAFVQSFLNRLRNKVMQVELIDNQFGFLVKSHDLEQCVEFLCKSFISFSEKQYESRTRKLMLQLQMFQSELMLTKQDLAIQKSKRLFEKTKIQSLIKSQVFSKVNSIILSYYNIKNREEQLLERVLSIQSQIHEDLSNKYLQFILSQTTQNQILMRQFNNFKQQLSGMFKHDIKVSNQILQSKFSENIHKIIGRPVNLQSSIPLPSQKNAEYSQEQMYQKHLKKQNYLYKLKLSTTQQKYEVQISSLKKELNDKQKIMNSLLIQKRKTELLVAELDKTNELLKKCQASLQQLKVKHEDTQHKNYKLTRLLQQANMKLTKSSFYLPSIRENKSGIRNTSAIKEEMGRSISMDPGKFDGKIQSDWKQKYKEIRQQNKCLTSMIQLVNKECDKSMQTRLANKIKQIIQRSTKEDLSKSKIIQVTIKDIKSTIGPSGRFVRLKTDT